MLRLAGLPYTAQMADVRDTTLSPKQKVVHLSLLLSLRLPLPPWVPC